MGDRGELRPPERGRSNQVELGWERPRDYIVFDLLNADADQGAGFARTSVTKNVAFKPCALSAGAAVVNCELSASSYVSVTAGIPSGLAQSPVDGPPAIA